MAWLLLLVLIIRGKAFLVPSHSFALMALPSSSQAIVFTPSLTEVPSFRQEQPGFARWTVLPSAVLPTPVRPHRFAALSRASTYAASLLSAAQPDPFRVPFSTSLA